MMEVAQAHPGNPFLEFRGNPGTHDLKLLDGKCRLLNFLDVLKDLVSGKRTSIPQYDKSAFYGRGDRLSTSRVIDFKPKVVILEGWCIGFQHTNDYIEDCHLRVINQNLKCYEFINQYFHAFVHLVAQDINFVYSWRFEQEDTLRKKKDDDGAGLSKNDLKDFIDRFIPVYSIGVPKLRQGGLFPKTPKRQLEIVLNHDRLIASHNLI